MNIDFNSKYSHFLNHIHIYSDNHELILYALY